MCIATLLTRWRKLYSADRWLNSRNIPSALKSSSVMESIRSWKKRKTLFRLKVALIFGSLNFQWKPIVSLFVSTKERFQANPPMYWTFQTNVVLRVDHSQTDRPIIHLPSVYAYTAERCQRSRRGYAATGFHKTAIPDVNPECKNGYICGQTGQQQWCFPGVPILWKHHFYFIYNI
jgi:hypothetical protein